MCRNQFDIKRSRLWVERLKGSLSVEHPIAGDELRAIKRHLAAICAGRSSPSARRNLPVRPSTTNTPQK